MTKDIANIFKNSLETLKQSGLISDLEGLVRTLEYKPSGAEKSIKIPYPVECLEPEVCLECESVKICVPEKSKKCLVYFEGTTASEIASLVGATKYGTTLSLVCWYNLGFFQKEEFLQTTFISTFSNLIKKTSAIYSENCPIAFHSAEVVKVFDNDPSIFSKYSYNEQKSDFLGCKYSSFKIDFNVKFLVYENTNCINSILGISNDVTC